MKTRCAIPLRLSALVLCAGILLPVQVGAQYSAPAKPAVQEKKALPAPKPAAAPKAKKKSYEAAKQYEEAMAADDRKPASEPVQAIAVCGPKPFLCNDTF